MPVGVKKTAYMKRHYIQLLCVLFVTAVLAACALTIRGGPLLAAYFITSGKHNQLPGTRRQLRGIYMLSINSPKIEDISQSTTSTRAIT